METTGVDDIKHHMDLEDEAGGFRDDHY